MSDFISIKKIKQGDITEFDLLFRSYYQRLCVYAESITRSEMASEEIVSELFMKIWEQRAHIEIRTSIESYLVSAIHNQSLNYLKHVKVKEKYREAAQYQLKNIDLLQPDNASDPLAPMITAEIIHEIEQIIDTLPAQCREVFVLNKFEELSYNDIAEMLNVSVNTVRTQIVRAMRKMKTSLKHHLPSILLCCLFEGIILENLFPICHIMMT